MRIFDLHKPDAEPIFLGAADTAHDGTIKSVVWIDEWNTVTAAEDGSVKYVSSLGSVSPPILIINLNADGGMSEPSLRRRHCHFRHP